MKCKVKVGFVFHATNEIGLPVVYHPGEFVEIEGARIPAQLEAPCVRPVVAPLDNLGGGNERTIWKDITKQFKVKR